MNWRGQGFGSPLPRERSAGVRAMPFQRHCEERSDEAIQIHCEISGLLRGACHRAGHFGPDPLARNDGLPPRFAIARDCEPTLTTHRGGGKE